MGSLGKAYTPRHYIIADTDHMSKKKIETFEKTKDHRNEVCSRWILDIFLQDKIYNMEIQASILLGVKK